MMFLIYALGFFTVDAGLCGDHGSAPGKPCSVFCPCRSGMSCQPGVMKCYHNPRRVGEPCVAGYGCASGLTCEAGSHVCRGPGNVGDACHATRPCRSGLTCEAGQHVCRAPGQAGDPCHATRPCGGGLTCEAGNHICRAPGDVGDQCHATMPCKSGLHCEAAVHVCRAPGKSGDPCHATRPCGGGLTCDGWAYVCRAPGKEDDPCHTTRPCGTGLTCEAFVHVCRAPGKLGDPCHMTRPCIDGLTCMAGKMVCVAPGELNESCHLTKPCREGLTCEAGVHKCRRPGRAGDRCHLTMPCGPGYRCKSGSHRCVPAGSAPACDDDSCVYVVGEWAGVDTKVLTLDMNDLTVKAQPLDEDSAQQRWMWDGAYLKSGGFAMTASAINNVAKVVAAPLEDDETPKPTKLWLHTITGRLRSNAKNPVTDAADPVMEMTANGEVRLTAEVEGESWQHWDVVPSLAFEAYKAWKETGNALMKAYYYDLVMQNFLQPAVGMSMDEYTESVKSVKDSLEDLSGELESLDDDFGVAKQVGGGAQIAGGAILLTGLLFAPFLGPLALAGATIGALLGTGLGLGGAVTSVTAGFIEGAWKDDKVKDAQGFIAESVRTTNSVVKFLNEHMAAMLAAEEYAKTEDAVRFVEDISRAIDAEVQSKDDLQAAGLAATEVGRYLRNTVKFVASFKLLKDTRWALLTSSEAYALSWNVKIARAVHAPGVRVSKKPARVALTKLGIGFKKIAGNTHTYVNSKGVTVRSQPKIYRVLVKGGTAAAIAIQVPFQIVGIAFGIVDVIQGTDQVNNKHEFAAEFTKLGDELQAFGNEALALYRLVGPDRKWEEWNGCRYTGPLVTLEQSTGPARGYDGQPVAWPMMDQSSVQDCATECSRLDDCAAFHFYDDKDPATVRENVSGICYLHATGSGPVIEDTADTANTRSRYAGTCAKVSVVGDRRLLDTDHFFWAVSAAELDLRKWALAGGASLALVASLFALSKVVSATKRVYTDIQADELATSMI